MPKLPPCEMPGLALANQPYLSVQAHSYGRKGTLALMLALEGMSNVRPEG